MMRFDVMTLSLPYSNLILESNMMRFDVIICQLGLSRVIWNNDWDPPYPEDLI